MRDTIISSKPKTPAKTVVDEAGEADGDSIAVEEVVGVVTEVDIEVDTEADAVAGAGVVIIPTTKKSDVLKRNLRKVRNKSILELPRKRTLWRVFK